MERTAILNVSIFTKQVVLTIPDCVAIYLCCTNHNYNPMPPSLVNLFPNIAVKYDSGQLGAINRLLQCPNKPNVYIVCML